MSLLEIAAAALGLINVALVVRRTVWNYPFGIVMVILYAFIFFEAKLYSDALLQVFFLVVQVYGWTHWSRHRGGDGLVPPVLMGARGRQIAILATAAGAAVLGYVMDTFTDAALPYWDAAIAGLSVTGQILLSVRRVENWAFWIAADILGIGVYWAKDLHVTSGLYAVFLVMATVGLITWTRRVRAA